MQPIPEPPAPTISVVIPTYRREQVLVDTLHLVTPLLQPGDEMLVIDQTPVHGPQTEQALRELADAGVIRWVRRDKPNTCAAMNAGARLARGDVLLFLDDDVIPDTGLLEAHRVAMSRPDPPPAVCGQVLQPWHQGPVPVVRDFALEFDPAYDKPCEILSPIACNLSLRRETFLRVGGCDENFAGPCYRLETELSYRINRLLGRKVAFAPQGRIVHLRAGGGTRTFGGKDTWGHIGGSMGDYYFAVRCLPWHRCAWYSLKRFVRAPVNRYTLRRPWLVPVLYVREAVAWLQAAGRAWTKPNNYIKDAACYGADVSPAPVAV
jgi:glycosyltransferase involved in cell wall biosynthesis